MKYIQTINEYFTPKEELELKTTVNKLEYFNLIYNKYKDLDFPTGKDVITDLKFAMSLFPDLEIKIIYPIFELIINNKLALRDFNYDDYKEDGFRKMRKEIEKHIKLKSKLKIKRILPKDSELESQIKSINNGRDPKLKVTKDTIFINELYKLLGDNNITYLSVFYKVYLNTDNFNYVIEHIKSLNTITNSFDELKGNLTDILNQKSDKQLEYLSDFNRNAKLNYVINTVLDDNIFYKKAENKSVIYNYVKQLIFQENIKTNTNYLTEIPVTNGTEKILKTVNLNDFRTFIVDIKKHIKGPTNREDLFIITDKLGKDNVEIIDDINNTNYNYVILLSKSFEANKELTCGTSWCTATDSSHAQNYTIRNMDYYIFNFNAKNDNESIIGLNYDINTKELKSITLKVDNEVTLNKWTPKIENMFDINLSNDFCKKDDIINKILSIYKSVDDNTLIEFNKVLKSYNKNDTNFDKYYEYLFDFKSYGNPIETLKHYNIEYDAKKGIIKSNLSNKHIDYLAENDVYVTEVHGNITYI